MKENKSKRDRPRDISWKRKYREEKTWFGELKERFGFGPVPGEKKPLVFPDEEEAKETWTDTLKENLKENRAIAGAREKLSVDRNRRFLRWVFDITVTVIFSVLAAIYFFQPVIMQESSMEPTLSVGYRYFVNRAVYTFSSPQRGDIIVFKTNGSDDAALHISRVIGLPGETVQIVDGEILIDGEVYEDTGDYPEIVSGGLADSSVTLESGEYFVLGDNRNNSEDSRYGDIGNIKKKYIVGKIWFTISPLSEIGFVDN